MGIESHNADFFVITQTTPEQIFYCAPGRSREISRQVDRDVFHRGRLLTILTGPDHQVAVGSSLYQNCIKTPSHLASWRCWFGESRFPKLLISQRIEMKKCNPWNVGARLGGDRSIHLSYVPGSGS